MDQQNQNPTPKRVPTEAEIARLEAEAAAAIQRGDLPVRNEAPAPTEAPAQAYAPRPEETPAPGPDFVPYVDDVADAPQPKSASAEIDGDDDEGEYIPGPWEKRVDALSPKQWKLAQIAGGTALGLAAVALLFIGGDELSTYRLIVAALLALFAPRYLERVLRRPLNVGRRAMLIAMVAALAVVAIVIALRGGFTPTATK